MKEKSKRKVKGSAAKNGNRAVNKKLSVLNRFKVIGIIGLILGGLVAGYFIWQNSIYFTVTLESVHGVTYTYDELTVKKGKDFTFDISLEEKFFIYDDLFAVTVNGEKIEKTDDHYVVKNVNENLNIFVSGVGSENLDITDKALTGATNIEEDLYIPYGVESIASSSFQSQSALKKVIIPDSVKIIGAVAFYNCVNLASIEMGGNVERIGVNAFYQTAWFNGHADGMVYLGNWLYAFKGYSSSKNFIVKDGIVGIAEYVFNGLVQTETVELPATLKYICGYAFCDISLKELNLPQGLKYIGANAFLSINITELVIPQSVGEIGANAFMMCEFLQSVTIESVAEFGNMVFTNCDALTSVNFVNGAKNISENMFVDCDNLEEIIINSANVPVLDHTNAFSAVPNLKIYVPENSVSAYKTANGWSVYSDKIYAIA